MELKLCPDIHLGIVHEELFGQHVPAGVSVKVWMFVQKPGDDVNMNCRVKMLQLLKSTFLSQFCLKPWNLQSLLAKLAVPF